MNPFTGQNDPEVAVFGQNIGPTPGGGFSVQVDGQQYDGCGSTGFLNSPGEGVQGVFEDRAGRRNLIIMGSSWSSQRPVPNVWSQTGNTGFPGKGPISGLLPLAAGTWTQFGGLWWNQGLSNQSQLPFPVLVTTANFTQPAVSASVSIVLSTNEGLSSGDLIAVAGAGYYTLTAISGDGFTVTGTNMGYPGGLAPTGVSNAGAAVSTTGVVDQVYTANPILDPLFPVVDTGLGYCTIAVDLPPTGSTFTLISVKVNGTAWAAGGWPTPSANNVAFTYGASYGSNTFPSSFGAVTSIEIQYAYLASGATQLQAGDDAALVALCPAYLGMYPDTKPTTHQIFAVALPDFAPNPDGGATNFVKTPITDSGTSGLADWSESLTETSTPANTLTSTQNSSGVWLGLDAIGADVGYSLDGLTLSPVLWISTTGNGGGGSAMLPITYQYANGTPNTYTEMFNAGNVNAGLIQDFPSDGSTYVFTLDNPPIVVVGTVLQQPGATSLASSNSTTQVTLTAGPTPVGSTVEITYTGTVLSNIGVRYPILSLLSVTVGGTPDLSATFSGYVVTLSSPASPGDTVIIQYTSQPTLWATDTFTPTSTAVNSFTLSHPPMAGTLSAPSASVNSGSPPQPFQFLVNGSTVQINIQLPASTGWTASYFYNLADGNLWITSNVSIYEFDLVSHTLLATRSLPLTAVSGGSPLPPVDLNPTKLFTGYAQDGTGLTPRWVGLWAPGTRYSPGRNYDTLTDSYDFALPNGLYWRARTTGTVLGTDYTRQPWPTELASADPYLSQNITQGSNPPQPLAPGILRRTASDLGFSMVAGFGCQGSFAPIGGGGATINGYQVPGDLDSTIRLCQRDKTKTWQFVNELSVLGLVADATGGHAPIYVAGCGMVHRESDSADSTINLGNPTFPCSRPQQGLCIDAGWPWANDGTAVFVALSWTQIDWGNNNSDLLTRALYTTYPVGASDAGLTVWLIGPDGTKLSHVTIKGDPTYSEAAFADVTAGASYTAANQPAYDSVFPDFGAMPGIWQSALGLETYPNPGPTLADISGTGQDFYYLDSFGLCLAVTKFTGLDVVPGKKPALKAAGIPALGYRPKLSWSTPDNSQPGTPGQINGEDTQGDDRNSLSLMGDGSNSVYALVTIPYWMQGENFIAPADVNRLSIPWNTPSTPGMLNSGNAGTWFLGVTLPGEVPAGNYPGFTLSSGTWGINWYYTGSPPSGAPPQFLPDPIATFLGTYGSLSGSSAGTYGRMHNTGSNPQTGFSATGVGIAVLGLAADCRQSYTAGARQFLVRIDYDATAKTASIGWSIDISQKVKLSADPAHTTAAAVSVVDPWNDRFVTGRFIGVLRGPATTTWTTPANANMFLDTRKLGDGTLWTTCPLPVGVPYSPQVPTNVSVIQGFNTVTGAEWALVSGLIGSNPVRWLVEWETDLTVAPTVTWSGDNTFPGKAYPSALNAGAMVAQGNSIYGFLGDDGSVITKPGA